MAHLNILLVDQELLSRELLTNHLKQNGFAVQVAVDSAEALKIISRNRFPLAIISSGIVEKSVGELIARIHARQKNSLVYLLVSHAGSYDVEHLDKIGAYDTIVRPFRLEDVKLKMRHALELLALRENAGKFSGQLQRLESRLRQYKQLENLGKIPDHFSLELPEPVQKNEPSAVGKNRVQAVPDPVQSGQEAYRPQRQTREQGSDIIEQIRRLDELRMAGILTEQEFKAKKKELLERI